jgi:hypothetical protein
LLESGDSVDPVVEANVTGRGTFQDTSASLAEYEAVLEELPGFSGNREQMVKRIESRGLERVNL